MLGPRADGSIWTWSLMDASAADGPAPAYPLPRSVAPSPFTTMSAGLPIPAEVPHRRRQALLQRRPRLPAQLLAGQRHIEGAAADVAGPRRAEGGRRGVPRDRRQQLVDAVDGRFDAGADVQQVP